MNKQIYQERRTYLHYDAGRFMLYLNEGREEYIPSVAMPAEEPENLPVSAPVMGYSYEGEEIDGGTLISLTRHPISHFTAIITQYVLRALPYFVPRTAVRPLPPKLPPHPLRQTE